MPQFPELEMRKQEACLLPSLGVKPRKALSTAPSQNKRSEAPDALGDKVNRPLQKHVRAPSTAGACSPLKSGHKRPVLDIGVFTVISDETSQNTAP